MKTNKIDKMIYFFREGENLILESRTEMANHTNKRRKYFEKRGLKLKAKGYKLYKYLINEIGIDEEYLEEILNGEGI